MCRLGAKVSMLDGWVKFRTDESTADQVQIHAPLLGITRWTKTSTATRLVLGLPCPLAFLRKGDWRPKQCFNPSNLAALCKLQVGTWQVQKVRNSLQAAFQSFCMGSQSLKKRLLGYLSIICLARCQPGSDPQHCDSANAWSGPRAGPVGQNMSTWCRLNRWFKNV